MVATESLHPAVEYLANRGISLENANRLGIHCTDYETAISEHYGYGKLSTSPDGLIVFPFHPRGDGLIISAARNLYATDESQQQHLEIINKYLRSRGKEPEKNHQNTSFPQEIAIEIIASMTPSVCSIQT